MKKIAIIAIGIIIGALLSGSCSNIMISNDKSVFFTQDSIKIPVLMYHHFDRNFEERLNSTIVTPEEFEDHLITLKENGYRSISFYEFYEYKKRGRKIPEKSFILTMDDGYLSNYSEAFPLLKKYDTKAAISVVTSTVGKQPGKFPHFTWDQAREMEQSGLVEIYNHTLNHKSCSAMSKDELIKNANEAQNDIETNLGKRKVKVFTYPEGSFTAENRKIIEELGFAIQLTVNEGLIDKDTPLNDIKRINIGHGWSGRDIISLIEEFTNRE